MKAAGKRTQEQISERGIREQWDRLLARGCNPELLITALELWRDTYGWRPTDREIMCAYRVVRAGMD
ncbi:MAG TPA: hypothetical protein VMU06_07565 [Stellaceae bacterium]|nr:hypothetical protein [Stellaceae bacterium]